MARVVENLPPDLPQGLKFLYCLSASSMHRQPASSMHRVWLNLAGELDAQDLVVWWPAVRKFIALHQKAGGAAAQAGEETADAALRGGSAGGSEGIGARGGAEVGDVTYPLLRGGGRLALEVLGGTLPRLSQGVEVALPDGRPGFVIHASPDAVCVSMRDGSLRQCPTKHLYPCSVYAGRLGPRSLGLLLAHVLALKDTNQAVGLFSVAVSDISNDAKAEDESVVTSSFQEAAMLEQVRVFKALVHHASAYDGYGMSSEGDQMHQTFEFSTKGAEEVAEQLDAQVCVSVKRDLSSGSVYGKRGLLILVYLRGRMPSNEGVPMMPTGEWRR